MRIIKKTVLFLAVLIIGPAFSIARAEEQWVPVALHVATTVSDGNLALNDVVEVLRSQGVKAVIVTDRDFMEWEYGLWPLRNLFKKKIEAGSVFRSGVGNYLKKIEAVSQKYRDVVIIPGLESAPFYCWEGFPFRGSLKLKNWHKHLLVVGLEDPEDYKDLPVLANKPALRCRSGVADLWRFWPILFLAFGVYFLLAFPSKSWRRAGIALIVSGALFLLNNNTFSRSHYDQYSSRVEPKPYQMLIDYVNRKGGMTFWAHPEASNISERRGIKIETEDSIGDLWNTMDYTGFAIFYEGYERVGKPGGEWDRLLREYCAGRRSSPVWAVAGLAFDNGTKEDLARIAGDVRTYVLAKDITKRSILEAMRRGKMYATRGGGPREVVLDSFLVQDGPAGEAAGLGGQVGSTGSPVLVIKGHSRNDDPSPVDIRLIRDGEVIETFKTASPFDIRYTDPSAPVTKTFYRLEIRNSDRLIVTNPIFVERRL